MRKLDASLRSDLDLMACIFLITVMAILMMLTGQVLLNLAYLGMTLLLVLMTYFFGLVIGLGANMVFVFGQLFYMVALNVTTGKVPLALAFWLVLPTLLCLAVAGVTANLRQVQKDNSHLRQTLVEHGAFDTQTHLRTTVSFLEDAAVYTETSRRFKIPVSVVVIRIRYFKDLQSMLGQKRIKELVAITSKTIEAATRDNDITYILNNEDPTWGVLLYSDAQGANIAADRIRKEFDQELLASSSLRGVDLRLKVGVVAWDPEKMKDANDLMIAGIKELEYDV